MHTLKLYYRPDNYPSWLPWQEFVQKFSMIGKAGALDFGGVPSARPGFAPRVLISKPPDACDDTTKRNLRRGYSFQVRFQGTGHVIINRFRLHAQRKVEKSTAK